MKRVVDDLARLHPRWVAVAVIASSVALLATSDVEHEFYYEFRATGSTAHVELTETAPTALVHVNVRVLRLGKYDTDTTWGATSRIRGSVQRTGIAAGEETGISVRIDAYGNEREPFVVVNGFNVGGSLGFDGDCRTFANENPCVAAFAVELSRGDAGANGGVVAVDVTPDFLMKREKNDSPDEDLNLPWTVEVTTE